MANKPEDKLLQNIQNNDLSMTGKPVLVQNQLGIFYGRLEKADTRKGTALLSDGYMISPDRHITYTRYLDFVNSVIKSKFDEISRDIDSIFTPKEPYKNEDERQEYINAELQDNIDIFLKYKNSEIIISNETFREHNLLTSITDYASEGIALVNWRTVDYSNTRHVQPAVGFISLTEVMVVVPISNTDSYIDLMPDTEDIDNILAEKASISIYETKLSDLYEITPANTFLNLTSTSYETRDNSYRSDDWRPQLTVNTAQLEESTCNKM